MINHFFHINSRIPIIQLVAIAFSILLILLIPGVPKSYAHAFVIKSDPSPSQSLSIPPSKVDVYFSEPVDLRYSKLIVLDANGKQVDNKDIQNINNDQTSLTVTLPPGLKDGVYTISTKVLSQVDGHVTDNAFVFGIGESPVLPISSKNGGSANPASSSQLYIPEAIARFPALVGQVMIVGAVFATLWLWRPISKISWLKDSFQQTRNRIDRNLIILIIIGSIILVSSDFAIIYVQANSINVGIGEAIATKFGNVWIVRSILSLILLAISLFIYTRRLKKSNDLLSTSKKQVISILAIGIMTLVTTSLIGHGAANGQTLPITTDFIHNLAASVWIGGVIYLAFIVVPILRRSTSLEDHVKVSLLSLLIPRFSTIPVVILGIIVVTGPLLLYILESNIALTLASVYGKILIVKLSLAATMIGIGAYNQMIIYRQAYNNVSVLATRTTKSSSSSSSSSSSVNNSNAYRGSNNILRKVRRSLQRNHPNENNSNLSQTSYILSRFSKSTKAEAIVGIALVAAVAVLVNTGLPGNEFQNQLRQQSAAATILPSTLGAATNQQQGFISTKFLEADNSSSSSRAILSIDPFTPGNNIFKISYLDSNKKPLDIRSVQLKYTQTENGIGPIKVDAQKVSKGVFSASAAFGIPGPWNLQIEAVQGKANTLNLITSYDLLVKPKLSQLTFNVQEFKISNTNSTTTAQPLYPLYDKSRNVIWVGDTVIDSGKMLEFNLNSDKYIQHKITGTSIITRMALDSHNQLWFLDPLLKNLGQYSPETETSKIYKIPTQGIPSSVAIDSADNIWLTSSHTNDILRFDAQTKNFTILKLPTTIVADPIDITIDQSSGQIWVAELAGKLANIDPTKSYKVTEYAPTTTGNKNSTLKSPTALLVDTTTGNIFISEHDGQAVSVFNPILKTFNRFPILNKNGLPFGMAMDNYGNLWVAEHTVNKIAVIDPQTGASKEATIPTQNPFIQWITSDSKGNIWFAEQQGNSLGVITVNSNPLQPGSAVIQQRSNVNGNNQSNSSNNTIPKLSFSYPDIVGPSFAAGIIVSTLFYAKAVIDLKKSVAKLAAHH
jgi:copper transport protein